MMGRTDRSAPRATGILIITSILAPYRVAWFDELAKRHDVTVAYTRETAKDIRTEWLSRTAERCTLERLNSWIPIPGIGPALFERLRDPRFSVVILDGYSPAANILAGIFLRAMKRQYYINVDGPSLKSRTHLFKVLVKKMLFAAPTRFLCSSASAREYLVKIGVSEDRIHIHPFTSLRSKDILAAPFTVAEKMHLRSTLGLQGKRLVLAVGRFVPVKRFDLLIQSWAAMPNDYQLCIVGGGPEEVNYRRQIEQLELGNVLLVPFQSASGLTLYYQAADLFVLPSAGDVWGLVIVEAMANGLPVISTDKCVAAVELITNHVNGYVFKQIDDHRLAGKLKELLTDEQSLARMGAKSLEIIRPYTIENMALIHLALFEEALS